jgi:hypothetical protein
MAKSSATAASAFRRTLHELGFDDQQALVADPARFGQRAALLAAAEGLWGQQLGESLGLAEVKALLGVTSRQAVHDLVRRGRLLGLPLRNGRVVYPRFQFGPDGRPHPTLAAVLAALRDGTANPWTMASWFTTEHLELEGMTPAAWLQEGMDPERLVIVARRSAAPLAW